MAFGIRIALGAGQGSLSLLLGYKRYYTGCLDAEDFLGFMAYINCTSFMLSQAFGLVLTKPYIILGDWIA